MKYISAKVAHCRKEYAREFSASKPFQHVVIDEFLDSEFCARLTTDFPRFEERHALNEMGEVGGKAVRMNVRDISDAYREMDCYLQTSEFLDLVSEITGIADLIYDPDYIGGGTHENRDGQSLDPHIDFNFHPRTRWHRRLNLIIYFNDEWEADWGGELELHSNPWDAESNRTINVRPLMNKAVIFETTETSWHGFSRIQLPEDRKQSSRRSFAIYLYTRERPASETASPHATVYVPAGLSADWQTGRVLSEPDLHLLGNRFTRLRAQLRYLYNREKNFGNQIANLEYSLAEARSAQRMELQGYATQPTGPEGQWPDGWVGLEFAAAFRPTLRATALILDLWVPKKLKADQVLRIELDGDLFTQNLVRGSNNKVKLRIRSKAGALVNLKIRAAEYWRQADDESAGDCRELAYRITSAQLVH